MRRPVPPPRAETNPRARALPGSRLRLMPALGTWAFFLTFSGQGVRNLVGWWAFGVIAAVSGIAVLVVFLREGHRVPWRALPPATCAFAALCALSVLWSQYPRETLLAGALMIASTVVGVLLACALSLREMTDALSRSLEATLVLSILLELYVALVRRSPLPPVYMADWDQIPPSYYWVLGDLLRGGPIQGIVGNRNPLAFIALLTLLCVAVRWADRRVRPAGLVVWSALSIAVLVLTSSATVGVAAVVCGVAAGVLWLLRHVSAPMRSVVVAGTGVVATAVVAAAVGMHSQVTALLGRSADLSGRWEIWLAVVGLWEEHTILGWGWIMYWVPWIPMFRDLVVRADGTPTMSAHNAYIEALFQTGVVGAALVVVLVARLLLLSYRLAVRHARADASVLLPALVSTALLVQSFTESRLLSEGNWVVVCALGTWFGLHRLYEQGRGRASADAGTAADTADTVTEAAAEGASGRGPARGARRLPGGAVMREDG